MSRTYKDRPWRIRKKDPRGKVIFGYQITGIGEIRKINRRHDRVIQNQAIREDRDLPVIKNHNFWDAF